MAAGTNSSQQYPTLNIMYTWQDETALPEIKGGTAVSWELLTAHLIIIKFNFLLTQIQAAPEKESVSWVK